jgi:hypothetical protein
MLHYRECSQFNQYHLFAFQVLQQLLGFTGSLQPGKSISAIAVTPGILNREMEVDSIQAMANIDAGGPTGGNDKY